MNYIVATIDLDTTKKTPSYDRLDQVLAEHGLVCPHPKEWARFPRNTYIGKMPSNTTPETYADCVFDSVEQAGLNPTNLLIAATGEFVTITRSVESNHAQRKQTNG